MEDCDATKAGECAEKIRKTMKKHSVMYGRENIRVTLSCGVALYLPGEELYKLLARVDAALYNAKNGGRDRISVSK